MVGYCFNCLFDLTKVWSFYKDGCACNMYPLICKVSMGSY